MLVTITGENCGRGLWTLPDLRSSEDDETVFRIAHRPGEPGRPAGEAEAVAALRAALGE